MSLNCEGGDPETRDLGFPGVVLVPLLPTMPATVVSMLLLGSSSWDETCRPYLARREENEIHFKKSVRNKLLCNICLATIHRE